MGLPGQHRVRNFRSITDPHRMIATFALHRIASHPNLEGGLDKEPHFLEGEAAGQKLALQLNQQDKVFPDHVVHRRAQRVHHTS